MKKLNPQNNPDQESLSDINRHLASSVPVSRRQLVQGLGVVLTGLGAVAFVGCGGGSSGGAGAAATDASLDETDVEETVTEESDDGSVADSSEWLSGGTAAMSADFPPVTDPFSSGLGNSCTLTEAFTIGPCYFNVDDERDDISEGKPGVPMTLALKLVDENCLAVEGAVIEVWWCDAEGIYSGDNSESSGNVSQFNASFCTDNNSEALASRWFRGTKTTHNTGLVYFKGCFPGWYPSRTTHIHFRIVLNGNQQLISQFAFADDLANDIYLNHADYTGQAKDTSNARDTVFPSNGYEEYQFDVERQWDGSMLAYKAIQITV